MFGGFLPLIATALTSSAVAKETFGTNSIYVGLLYPIAVCIVTLVVGGLFIHETKDHEIDAHSDPVRQADFDWAVVLGALGVGLLVLLVVSSDFRQDASKLGILKALGSDVWIPLIGASGPVALPTLFFDSNTPESRRSRWCRSACCSRWRYHSSCTPH